MKKIVIALAILLLFAAPWIVSAPFFVHLMIMVLMWTVLGASWNILGGFTGQVSFGHATFLGAGAYTTMILYLKLGIAPWYGIPIGGLVAALIALPIGFICFRLRGPVFRPLHPRRGRDHPAGCTQLGIFYQWPGWITHHDTS